MRIALVAGLVLGVSAPAMAVANTPWTLTVYANGSQNFLGEFPTKTACEAGKQRVLSVDARMLQNSDAYLFEPGISRHESAVRVQAVESASFWWTAITNSGICERRG